MDRLSANQELYGNQELESANGWFRLAMHADGSLGVYRTQIRQSLWSAPMSPRSGTHAVMQGDGNFVCYAPGGTASWATGSDGHPGAFVVMQDDGNLVVYDRNNSPLWASDTVQDLRSPTIRYRADGYGFNETSESWKEMCSAFPCFAALHWPGYDTSIVEDVINGQEVVIQLWKGRCQKFLGFLGVQEFPGGFGGEVGIYRRIPGKARPTSLPFLPRPLETMVMNGLRTLADDELWWPFPELGAEIEFTLINPRTGTRFFPAGPEKSYWLAKWMDDDSYAQYQRDEPSTPARWEDYTLEYRINGYSYPAWSAGAARPRTIPRRFAAATTRSADKLDVFVPNGAGGIQTAAWEPSFRDGWHGWWAIGNVHVPLGAPVHVVSRNADKLDIFVTETAGIIQTAAWEPAFTDGWHGWWPVAGGRAAPGAAVTAVSRSTDKLDVFVVGTDGRVWTAAWEPSFHDGWHGWWAIGNVHVPLGAPVHVVSRNADKLDIFVTDTAGIIQTAAWEPAFTDGWHGWWPVAGGRAAPGAAVTAVSRSTDKLDVFVVGTDGRVWTAAWEPSFHDGWHGWWAIR